MGRKIIRTLGGGLMAVVIIFAAGYLFGGKLMNVVKGVTGGNA